MTQVGYDRKNVAEVIKRLKAMAKEDTNRFDKTGLEVRAHDTRGRRSEGADSGGADSGGVSSVSAMTATERSSRLAFASCPPGPLVVTTAAPPP